MPYRRLDRQGYLFTPLDSERPGGARFDYMQIGSFEE
jgi:hypothetical protein